MSETVTLSFRVSAEDAEKLDKLAKATDRPRSWLLEQALDAYLDLQAWQVEHIQAGLKDLREGRTIPHERVMEWLDSLGTDHEIDPPKCE